MVEYECDRVQVLMIVVSCFVDCVAAFGESYRLSFIMVVWLEKKKWMTRCVVDAMVEVEPRSRGRQLK
jgi:hypothetical protein